MRILVAGGAGFIGSHIVGAFLSEGHDVVVVDGLLPRTGGNRGNLPDHPRLVLHPHRVEHLQELDGVLQESDLVVDAMGWTRHLLALDDPAYDCELNVRSHLALLAAMPATNAPRTIYLGSRGQYGSPKVERIDEGTPCAPEDVQGIHKQAAESHWRVGSRLRNFPVASLRFGNTFGPRQPVQGRDIGLVGLFIRDLQAGKEIELYGEGRQRPLVFAPDLAQAVVRMAGRSWVGFKAWNVSGWDVPLEDLVERLCKLIGHGSWRVASFPDYVRAIDVGNATFDGRAFQEFVGGFRLSSLEDALAETVEYFIHTLS